MPTDSELVWLPGLGVTSDSVANTKCQTVVIERTAGMVRWDLISDPSGIVMSAFKISNGDIYSYGLGSQGSTNTQTFTFTPDYPMVGIYGYASTGGVVSGLGCIFYDSSKCPKWWFYDPAEDPNSSQNQQAQQQAQAEAEAQASTSWWETASGDGSSSGGGSGDSSSGIGSVVNAVDWDWISDDEKDGIPS